MSDIEEPERKGQFVWSPIAPKKFKHAKIINDGTTPLKPAEVKLLEAEYKRLFRGATPWTFFFSAWNRGYMLMAACPCCWFDWIAEPHTMRERTCSSGCTWQPRAKRWRPFGAR